MSVYKELKKLIFIIVIVLIPIKSLFAFEVHLSTNTFYPGDTLAVWVTGVSPRSKITCSFLGKRYPAYSCPGDKKRALLGIPLDVTPGEVTVEVFKKAVLFTRRREKTVMIKEKEYPETVLKVSRQKRQLIGAPRNRVERKMVQKVLSGETEAQLWHKAFSLPLKARISSPYGVRRKLSDGRTWGQHNGVDFAAPQGVPVKASSNGRVVLTEDFNLMGKTILIDHGQGVVSVYLHLNSIETKEGMMVHRGDVIGTVGSTGFSTSAHLHWGIYIHGIPVDPVQWTEAEF